MRLQLGGDIYAHIETWQTFASRYPKSPLLPYALFHIMNLYHTAYSLNTSQSDKELSEIRAYAAEMSKALAEYPLAPSYLKAMARHSYAQIMRGDPILYNLALLK
jgi:hypothetical protein